MGVFVINVKECRPLFSWIAAHGMTDVDQPLLLETYASWLLLPLPGAWVTALFGMASVVHFAEELTLGGSMVFHLVLMVVRQWKGEAEALRIMMLYLGYLHVPAHYARCAERGRWGAVAVAGGGTLALHALGGAAPTVELTHTLQRIVIAHVACELGVASTALAF